MINGLDSYKKKWALPSDPAIKPGLETITAALAELGDPHKTGKFVHIAGTNGKGSTAAFLTSILREHGHSVGNFFSPAIEDLHDQIQIDGVPVSPEDLDRVMEKLTGIKTPLTDFELLTAAAFLVFQDKAPDYAIIEAGMGGRFDSTNVIDPEIAIIPSIALEHVNFLGDSLEKIALHKSGIIKKWKPVVVGPLPPEASKVVEETARSLHAEVIRPAGPLEIELKLKGSHQKWNAALADEAAKELLGLAYDAEKACKALAGASIPFRFEEIFPDVILDGAHNAASIQALADTVTTCYPDRPIHIVMGLLKDKDYIAILRQLETFGTRFTFVDFENKRALPAEILFSENRCKIKTIVKSCDILPVHKHKEVTIVTGSLYLLSKLKRDDYRIFQNLRR
ncbi:dihydrofolate synthase/folylpolyglutamate synthase [Planomicrobium koreense]|uniref:tetrahydrofolate synthase n=1 Tax=Planococcus koreensis TaxID=112331 RepID=A0A7W8CUM3_9BACL|nr:folylpolyglutamate synthase/dihydrofolate synthase family protein [Planococcus koreensis]MBB5180724.1 dihydrofolate synthase/folylpolyglutamate synthase [Planococcus koreensis]